MEFDELVARLEAIAVSADLEGFDRFAAGIRSAIVRATGSRVLFSTRDHVFRETARSAQRDRAKLAGPDPRD